MRCLLFSMPLFGSCLLPLQEQARRASRDAVLQMRSGIQQSEWNDPW